MGHTKKNVLVIGCGAAGYPAAKTLARGKGVDVTVVDSNSFFEFKPALYSIMEGKDRDYIGFDLERRLRPQGITFVNERVEDIVPEHDRVDTETLSIHYDQLLVALGGEVIDFGIDPDEVYYISDYTSASQIREQALEKDSVAILGGGVTGTEAAFTLHNINPSLDITLIEGGERIASQLNENDSQVLEHALEENGVTVRTGEIVNNVDDGRVSTSKDEYDVDMVIQATGVRPAQPVREAFGEDGLVVDETLQSVEHDNIYGAGDAITLQDGSKIRRAYHATKESEIVSINMLRTMNGVGQKLSYTCEAAPIIITLGGWRGLLEYGSFSMQGILPHIMEKIGVEKRYILQYKYFT